MTAELTALVVLLALACGVCLWRLTTLRKELHHIRRQHEHALEEIRREHNQALDEAHREREALFHSLPEGVLVVDAEGRILLANAAWLELFKLSSDFIGHPLHELPAGTRLVEVLNQTDGGLKTVEMDLSIPGQGERFLEIKAAPLRGTDGQRRGTVLVFHDLTRVRQLEKTRQDFVANVSHELRTPLSLIKGFVETLLDGAKDDPAIATRFLQNIEKHANRLVFLIEDLLTISRLESRQVSLNRQPVNLHALAERVIDDLESRAAEKQTRLINKIPTDWLADADADRLQQVLWNLIENAIKYGRQHGTVTITARRVPPGRVEVCVNDDGPGIPPEARDRVFERFYRVDRARSRETGGTGLGLSIVKHIIQAHGGEVWVKSEVQRGASFYFTLPEARQEQSPSVTKSHHPRA